MDFFESMCFAKLFCKAMGCQMSMSDAEIETSCEMLKKMADWKWNWTEEEKVYYKMMVDTVKEITKRK